MQASMRVLPLGRCYSVSDGKPVERRSSRPSQDCDPPHGSLPHTQSVVIGCCQRLDRLSGLGTHLVMAAFHSTGASKRLSVVTLRIRRYTCNGQTAQSQEFQEYRPRVSLSIRKSCIFSGHLE